MVKDPQTPNLAHPKVEETLGEPVYRGAPDDVARLLEAAATPQIAVSPRYDAALLVDVERMPPIAALAETSTPLAGIRVSPQRNCRHAEPRLTDLEVVSFASGEKTPLLSGASREDALPEWGLPRWSPNGEMVSLPRYREDGVDLAVVSRHGGKPTVVVEGLNRSFGSGYAWMPGARRVLCTLVPPQRGAAPIRNPVPQGPTTFSSRGEQAGVLTFQDLLKDAHDEALFDFYATSQLTLVDVADGSHKEIGDRGLYASVSPSPNGEYLLVQRVERPYSYVVPYARFPKTVEIWNLEGDCVKVLVELPLAGDVPVQGVRQGPRAIRWQPTEDATLDWLEALDGGDPMREVSHRDRLMRWSAPFDDDPVEWFRAVERIYARSWFENGQTALVSEYDRKRRWRTTWQVCTAGSGNDPRKILDLSLHQHYEDPGSPVHVANGRGGRHLLHQDGCLFLVGRGATPEGLRPFVHKLDLESLMTTEVFGSGEDELEQFVAFVDGNTEQIVTQVESHRSPTNYQVRDIGGGVRRLTQYTDPAPEYSQIEQHLLTYARHDGVSLTGKLFLPPGQVSGERLPMVIYAYPEEHVTAETAGQVRGSANRFPRFVGASPRFFVTQGYAVLEDARIPIVGDPDEVNDTFVDQTIASARAAIEHLDGEGIIDPAQVGVVGASYGAFMVANLLAHSDLFRAGIALYGAYNRTLTPFGFQSERRTLWEATETYLAMSPLLYADRVKQPMLLIHGELDNNPGTHLAQSRQMYEALKGQGKTARLVVMPREGHGFLARESIEHVLVEMFDWFNRYVRSDDGTEAQ